MRALFRKAGVIECAAALVLLCGCSSAGGSGPVYSAPSLPQGQAAFLHPAATILADDEETNIGGLTIIEVIDGVKAPSAQHPDHGYSMPPGTHQIEVSFVIRQLDKQAATSGPSSYGSGPVGLVGSLATALVKEAMFAPEVVRWKSQRPQAIACEVESGISYQVMARRTAGDTWIAWCKEWKAATESEQPQAPPKFPFLK